MSAAHEPSRGTMGALTGSATVDRWRAARRVLLVRLDNLGDVLMTTPAMAAVRESLPEARLTLLAAPGMRSLQPHLPMLDEIIGFHAPWMKAGAGALETQGREGKGVGKAARGEHERLLLHRLLGDGGAPVFDAAILFTVCTQSVFPAALLCRMAGIPLVLGHARERAYGLLSDEITDHDVVGDGMRHEVRRQLDLVAQVGFTTSDERLRFSLSAAQRDAARRQLSGAGVAADQSVVLVHPGASAPSRRYPPELFGQAATLIERQDPSGRTRAVLCAGPDEAALVEAVRASMAQPAIVLPPPAGIGALAALVEQADLLVANNSGPVHLAAAIGTPVVDLYALTNPQHTPWQVPARVLSRDVPCRHCQKSVCPQVHHRCLRGVAPQEVASAAREMLAMASARTRARGGVRERTAAATGPSIAETVS